MDDWMDAYQVEYEVPPREEKEWHDAWMDVIADAGRILENADKDLHDYSVQVKTHCCQKVVITQVKTYCCQKVVIT